ncbi:hypothetical protein [Shewanella subflava]|uniref:Uncharacterized protein n=1 Tax=Shewanella subflava TaxID=2986476 RepID=A0ABT3I5V7_9GAMM|nr:hypothetical protein [Shewanella subflava]MCW3171437.1 hypothetical protein [Shewanella subflava]
MSKKILPIIRKQSLTQPMSLLEVDMDADAESFIVIDRRNFSMITKSVRPTSGIVKVLLGIEYSQDGYCIVGIIDNDKTYDCKFVDGVKLQAVDANLINMSQ